MNKLLLVSDDCSSHTCELQFGPRVADEEEVREEAADKEEEEKGSLTELATGRHSSTGFVKRRA